MNAATDVAAVTGWAASGGFVTLAALVAFALVGVALLAFVAVAPAALVVLVAIAPAGLVVLVVLVTLARVVVVAFVAVLVTVADGRGRAGALFVATLVVRLAGGRLV